jgi:hypothetical protein
MPPTILWVVKHAASAATGSYHYYCLVIWHLLIEIMQRSVIVVVSWTGDQKRISIFGIAHVDNAKSFYVINKEQGVQISLCRNHGSYRNQNVVARVTLFSMWLI